METINVIRCPACGATADPKDHNRFAKRHPSKCVERREFNKRLAQGTRCTEPTTFEEHNELRRD